jgi:hypothetical protein
MGSFRLAATAVALGMLSTMPGMAQDKLSQGEARKIAEEAFVYGFPTVMNYGVFYDYFIDKASPNYKAPFNQINNVARVFTPQDTAVVTPNSDTPYTKGHNG